MKRAFALLTVAAAILGVLMLGACSVVGDLSARFDDPEPQGPELVLKVEGEQASGTIVYALNMRKPQLVYPLIHWVDDGFYDGMYVSRVVPGIFVQTDNGYWTNRKSLPRVVPPEPVTGSAAGVGNLGLAQNADGSFGPRLVMMTGSTLLEQKLIPLNSNIGVLVEGGDILKRLKKGDRIVKAYGRSFRAQPEPFY